MSATLTVLTRDGGTLRFEEPDFRSALRRLARLAEGTIEVKAVSIYDLGSTSCQLAPSTPQA